MRVSLQNDMRRLQCCEASLLCNGLCEQEGLHRMSCQQFGPSQAEADLQRASCHHRGVLCLGEG